MSSQDEEKEGRNERGFTVVDRRGGGEAERPSEPEATPRSEPGPAAAEDLPRIDFATFLISLGTSALYHMGLVADPESGGPATEPNLPLARQTIDTLEMLEEKTRGNLDEEEAKLLQSLLYELRMRFIEVSK